jgi:hypothetical protein
MSNIVVLIIIIHSPSLLFSQYTYPYENYKDGRFTMLYHLIKEPRRPEILSPENQQMIIDSVHKSLLRYKIKSYSSLYKLDSIFSDSVSMAVFLQNPYILEYPELKGYQIAPRYQVKNLARGQMCYYIQAMFEVLTLPPNFIRSADLSKGVSPDTVYSQILTTKVCGLQDQNTIVFFHTPTKTLRILGGCLEVNDLSEEWGYANRKESADSMAEVYAQARTAGLAPLTCQTNEFDQLSTFDFGLDSIGSMKIGKREEGYHFFRIAHETGCFPDICPKQKFYPDWTLAWFIQIRVPKERWYGYHTHSNQEIIAQEAEEWDDVEAIKFSVDEPYLKLIPSYVPGFKAYELRIRFKKNPTPADSNIHLRGLTDKEIKELRKIDCLRPFRPGVWDSY